MGMDVYAWAKHDAAPEICIMQWRKPYEFANWLLLQLTEEEVEEINDHNYAFSVFLTFAMLKTGLMNESVSTDLTDCDFHFRAWHALKSGYQIEIVVSP